MEHRSYAPPADLPAAAQWLSPWWLPWSLVDLRQTEISERVAHACIAAWVLTVVAAAGLAWALP